MSRILILALASTGAVTALVFVIPDLIVIAGLALIIPGLLLALVPSLFLYNLTFSLAWFSLRASGPILATAAGVGAIALVALAVPDRLNRQTADWLQEASLRDLRPALPIEPAGAIAIEQPSRLWAPESCNDLCQLLLYNGVTERVIALPSPNASRGKKGAPGTSTVFRIERQPDCALNKATQAALKHKDNRWTQQARDIAKAVHFRIATGECLIAEPLADAVPGLIVRIVEENIGGEIAHLSPRPGNVRISGVEIRSQGKVIARESVSTASFLSIPFHLAPYGGGSLHLQGWEWGRRRPPENRFVAVEMLKNLTTFDLNIPRSASISEIRRHLDDALAHPESPGGAFLLAAEYYESFYKTPPSEDDDQRLTRMIGDDRLIDLSYFRDGCSNSKHLTEAMRDPILNRLLRRTRAEHFGEYKPTDDYGSLVAIAACLPPGAYRGSVPQLDALFADSIVRRKTRNLIPRLADQGTIGGTKLAAIVLSAWEKGYKGVPVRWEHDAEPAFQGLCRLGPEASALLPELRRFQSRFPGSPIFKATFWPVTLVSLGADPAEFPVPAYQKDPARYREDLRKQAQRCNQQK